MQMCFPYKGQEVVIDGEVMEMASLLRTLFPTDEELRQQSIERIRAAARTNPAVARLLRKAQKNQKRCVKVPCPKTYGIRYGNRKHPGMGKTYFVCRNPHCANKSLFVSGVRTQCCPKCGSPVRMVGDQVE